MPNITISIDEKLLKDGKRYAQIHDKSLNALIRDLLRKTVENESRDWLEECFTNMDKANASSKGKNWIREDLYDA